MSDSNIFDLSDFRKRSATGPTLRENGPTSADILRLRQIENVTKGKGPVFGRIDRMAAAQTIWLLVREAKKAGVTSQRIKEELETRVAAGKKHGTARLERYTLSQELSPEIAKQKSIALPQRVFGYLEAAGVIAQLTGQNPDDLKIRLLKETAVWSHKKPLGEIAEDPRASNLALLLREMAQRVIRRTKLGEVLSRARKIPGAWDTNSQSFTPSSMTCIYQPYYLGTFEHWTEAPPLPSIPLVRCVHAELFSTIRLEREAVPIPRADKTAASDQFDGEDRTVSFCLKREIRLALGPTTASEVIGPMLESRAHIEVRMSEPGEPFGDKTSILFPSMTLKPIDDVSYRIGKPVFQILLEDGWHRAVPLADLDEAEALVMSPSDHPLMWSPDPLDPGSQSVEHWYQSWMPLNERSVAYWLDRPTIGNRTMACTPSRGNTEGISFWYARPSAAAEVEEALTAGKLQNGLEEAVNVLRLALEERESRWLNDAEASTAKLMDTWRSEDAESE